MATPNLGIIHIAAAQNQKEVTANTAFDDLDLAMTGLLSVAMGSNYTLSQVQATQNIVFHFTGSLATVGIVTLPSSKKIYVVSNQTNEPLLFETLAGGRTVLIADSGVQSVPAYAYSILYCDGANVDVIGGSSAAITLENGGTANSSQTILNLLAGSNIIITDQGGGTIKISSTASGGASTKPQRQSFVTADGSSTTLNVTGEPQPTSITGSTANVETPSPSFSGGPAIAYTSASSSVSLGIISAVKNFLIGRNNGFSWIGWINAIVTSRNWIGFTDQTSATMLASDNPAGNYVCFRYSSFAGDTNWQAVIKNGTTQTVVNTGIAPTIDAPQTFAIIENSSAGTYTFYINGTLVATISSNTPAANTNVGWIMGQFNSAGSFNNGIAIHQIILLSDA